MKWKEQILDLPPYKPGKHMDAVKREYGLEKIVKLASNENPFGCSPSVREALSKNGFERYPDGYATVIRSELAQFLQVEENQLIFGNGADNLIQIISRSLLFPGRNTVMASPSFSQYKHNAVIEGAEAREIPLLEDGQHDLDSMIAAIDANTAVVWVCSPNNPTGNHIPNDKLTAFIDKVPEDVLVVIDEAYHDYVVADDYHHSLELLKKYKNLIVLRTFSKIYGIAALRVGYGIAQADTIHALEPVREPFNVSTLAQIAAVAALHDQDYVKDCREKNRKGMAQFEAFCTSNQLNFFPSQANFILIDFGTSGDEVFQYLIERGYIVRSGNALGFPTSVRVTVGSKEENSELIEIMEQYLQEKKLLSK
ncbi:histidinol-phosphate transaminase [Bacillus benzoevorans]|uniref:Histidinol-phosphate aminotransferase n=1 Tax=Bacillus benzoevorans TaxID=1456 RepID=A0A7X0HS53_9BACI|nr:histidinol-phosphate transaminase [Bacillus benzoevorans]MBB6444695.1 histidinol-phosphate aminotransferase [Bacillus benzoevorans]